MVYYHVPCNKLFIFRKKQAHWALYLLRFNFTLKHVPDTKIEKADGLSRRPDWKIKVEKDNDNQRLVKEEWI